MTPTACVAGHFPTLWENVHLNSEQIMKRPILGIFALAAIAAPLALAQPGPGPTPPPGGGERQPGGRGREGGGGERGGLEGAMKGMNQSLRELKANIDAADKKEQNILSVMRMQRALISAKGATSGDITGLNGADHDKVLAAYRKASNKLLGMLVELEANLLDGKTAEAKAMLPKLEAYRDEMHKQFKPDEEGKGKPEKKDEKAPEPKK